MRDQSGITTGALEELIDTQWDVNLITSSKACSDKTELIDTQWDVNLYDVVDVSDSPVELIDTQWDVNYIKEICIAGSVIELIDTQWDVNTEFETDMELGQLRINRYIVGCKQHFYNCLTHAHILN